MVEGVLCLLPKAVIVPCYDLRMRFKGYGLRATGYVNLFLFAYYDTLFTIVWKVKFQFCSRNFRKLRNAEGGG